MCVRLDAVLARGLLGIAALLVIGCINPERDVPVELEVKESDTELLADTVYAARAVWLFPRPCIYGPDCFPSPSEYGILVSGRIKAGTCDSLSARASEKPEGGTHYVTLNVRIVRSPLEGCSEDVSFAYDAAIEVRGTGSISGFDNWVLKVFHDDLPVPPYN